MALKSRDLICQDTAACVNCEKNNICRNWQTWNNQTQGKKLVEYRHICLGSNDSASKMKLGSTDQNPDQKGGEHQCCPCCCGRHHAFTIAQGRVTSYLNQSFYIFCCQLPSGQLDRWPCHSLHYWFIEEVQFGFAHVVSHFKGNCHFHFLINLVLLKFL